MNYLFSLERVNGNIAVQQVKIKQTKRAIKLFSFRLPYGKYINLGNVSIQYMFRN